MGDVWGILLLTKHLPWGKAPEGTDLGEEQAETIHDCVRSDRPGSSRAQLQEGGGFGETPCAPLSPLQPSPGAQCPGQGWGTSAPAVPGESCAKAAAGGARNSVHPQQADLQVDRFLWPASEVGNSQWPLAETGSSPPAEGLRPVSLDRSKPLHCDSSGLPPTPQGQSGQVSSPSPPLPLRLHGQQGAAARRSHRQTVAKTHTAPSVGMQLGSVVKTLLAVP